MANPAQHEAREEEIPPRVNWKGAQRAPSAAETNRARATALRVRDEVAEIRAAAARLASGTALEAAVAEFLTVQAEMLERAGSTPMRADQMCDEQDTLAQEGMFPSPARSALLIARAMPSQ